MTDVPVWLIVVLCVTFGLTWLLLLTCLVISCLKLCGCWKGPLFGSPVGSSDAVHNRQVPIIGEMFPMESMGEVTLASGPDSTKVNYQPDGVSFYRNLAHKSPNEGPDPKLYSNRIRLDRHGNRGQGTDGHADRPYPNEASDRSAWMSQRPRFK